MSLLLDVVLFIRKNINVLKLSSTERVVLISIAGRIGNNKETWIKQKCLAEECAISKRYLIQIINSLIEKKLITTQKDGRKNRYQCLIGKVIHSSPVVEERVIPDSPIIDDRCTVVHLNRCTTVHLSQDEIFSGSPVIASLKAHEEIPKEKDESNTISKRNKEVITLPLPEWLPKEDWNEFLVFRKSMKAPMGEVAQKRAINTLAKFYDSGQDVAQIIDQSIVNGWKGLFPVRGNYANGQGANQLTARQASLKRGWDVINNWH